MDKNFATKRSVCKQCLRPKKVCLCNDLASINNEIKLLIIQHPQEVNHPFNTGIIASQCLTNSEVIIAEKLNDNLLSQLDNHSALLYPNTPPFLQEPPVKQNLPIKQLIVIDATWRKAKKILFLNPQLQQLPRLSLSGNLTSNYQIRKTSIPNGLATIESIVLAFEKIEPQSDFKPLLKPFEKMIALQKGFIKS